jgi:hypothetical protein
MWVMDGAGPGCNNGKAMTWYDALTWVDTLVFAGFDDWQLPTDQQLHALANMSPEEIVKELPNATGPTYWSKIPGTNVDEALAIDLDQRKIVLRNKRDALPVRPCRFPAR